MTQKRNSYTRPRCGYSLNKKDAAISGFDSQSSVVHIHCPKCGKTITHL
ncbi:MAG: hypothetical protein WC325_08690 [Candidatus Bathyarchaeia archaeon]